MIVVLTVTRQAAGKADGSLVTAGGQEVGSALVGQSFSDEKGAAVAEVAAGHGLSWWTVQRTVNAAADALTDPDTVLVRRLGVDEHRYRSVRLSRRPEGGGGVTSRG